MNEITTIDNILVIGTILTAVFTTYLAGHIQQIRNKKRRQS